MSVSIKVLLFAKARELAGTHELTLNVVPNLSASDLVTQIEAQCPDLAILRGSFVLALNQDYVDHNQVLDLKSGDELAVIPPISGG
eukprot:TCALIF_09262-PA protein Name:"Similar to VP15 Molybdopterin synthase sulfur carrier subunit (Zea mays)" AED:0.46 eAED:0.46 QI:0/-1/0/1/-1/1/1/0/85